MALYLKGKALVNPKSKLYVVSADNNKTESKYHSFTQIRSLNNEKKKKKK